VEDNELDKMLDSFKVADADKALLDRIVATAQRQPANENTRRLWLQRSAMMTVLAVVGFWLGHVAGPVQQAASTTTATQSSYYLDSMIMGPQSLSDMGL
jgi:hypothetical protein